MPRLRTLLILGRVSNLPTVWSNCLAGWWFGGGGNPEKLPFILFGASFLYIGGMFLNDAFDVGFDSLNRRERPIPSGAISLGKVWRWGLAWLALGMTSLIAAGIWPGILGAILLVCIVMYDAIHKHFAVSPTIMAACRFLVYLVAASAGVWGVTGTTIWCALALAFYVLGLSYLARKETLRGAKISWSWIFLCAPIALALLLNSGAFRKPALLLSLILALWLVRSLAPLFLSRERRIGPAVSNLLAGIALVDFLACSDADRQFALIFLLLFGTTLLLQRFVPST